MHGRRGRGDSTKKERKEASDDGKPGRSGCVCAGCLVFPVPVDRQFVAFVDTN